MLESPTNQPQPYGTWHATEEIHRCQERIRIPHQTWDEVWKRKNINNWWILVISKRNFLKQDHIPSLVSNRNESQNVNLWEKEVASLLNHLIKQTRWCRPVTGGTYIRNSFLCLVANCPPNFNVSETSISSDHPLPTLGVPKYVNISWLEFCTKS